MIKDIILLRKNNFAIVIESENEQQFEIEKKIILNKLDKVASDPYEFLLNHELSDESRGLIERIKLKNKFDLFIESFARGILKFKRGIEINTGLNYVEVISFEFIKNQKNNANPYNDSIPYFFDI